MARSAIDETSDTGAFKRTASTFRNFISKEPSSQFPPESGRYHLYVSYACPWASRCLAYLKIKGLEKAISFTVNFEGFFEDSSLLMCVVIFRYNTLRSNLLMTKVMFCYWIWFSL